MKENKTTSLLLLQAGLVPLKILAADKIELLKRQQERKDLFKADTDLLLKRYHLEKSTIGKAVDWYFTFTQWEKIAGFIIILGTSSLIGGLIGLSIVLPIVAVLSTFLIYYLFNDYQKNETLRGEHFCAELRDMEKNMAETVEALNLAEKNIYKLILSLEDSNENFSGTVEILSLNIEQLNQEMLSLSKTSTNLAKDEEEITVQTQKLNNLGETFNQHLLDISLHLDKEIMRIQENNNSQELTQLTLTSDSITLASLSDTLNKQLSSVTAMLTTLMQDTLSPIQVEKFQVKENLAVSLAEGNQIIQESKKISKEVDDFLQEMEDDYNIIRQKVGHSTLYKNQSLAFGG